MKAIAISLLLFGLLPVKLHAKAFVCSLFNEGDHLIKLVVDLDKNFFIESGIHRYRTVPDTESKIELAIYNIATSKLIVDQISTAIIKKENKNKIFGNVETNSDFRKQSRNYDLLSIQSINGLVVDIEFTEVSKDSKNKSLISLSRGIVDKLDYDDEIKFFSSDTRKKEVYCYIRPKAL